MAAVNVRRMKAATVAEDGGDDHRHLLSSDDATMHSIENNQVGDDNESITCLDDYPQCVWIWLAKNAQLCTLHRSLP